MRTLAWLGPVLLLLAGCGDDTGTFPDLSTIDQAVPPDLTANNADLTKPCTDADGGAVNLANDPLDCGMCGHACKAGQACVGGVCQSSCPNGTSFCAGTC